MLCVCGVYEGVCVGGVYMCVVCRDRKRSVSNKHVINPRRTCAARVTVLSLCLCLCVCYSTSHFIHDYSCHKRY